MKANLSDRLSIRITRRALLFAWAVFLTPAGMGCSEQKTGSHDLCCRVWIPEEMTWTREPEEALSGMEYTLDGVVLVLDSSGIYRRCSDILRRKIGDDTIHFMANGWTEWTGAWSRIGATIQVRARLTWDYSDGDSAFLGRRMEDSLRMVVESDQTKLVSSSEERFVPFEALGNNSRRGIEHGLVFLKAFIESSGEL